MLLIPCPWCGPRPENEFRYCGQAHVVRPADPSVVDDAEWAAYLYLRDNPKGARIPNAGAMCTAADGSSTACATPSPTGSPSPADPATSCRHRPGHHDAALPHSGGRADRPRPAGSFQLRRQAAGGFRRRHAGLGPAGERRAPGRPVVQVPPAARHPVRRIRGTQRAGHPRSRRRAGHAQPARHPDRAV